MLDRQTAFDTMVAHLRRQGERAFNGQSCLYRTNDGLKCAVGALIPDEEYRESFEGVSAWKLIQDGLVSNLDKKDAEFFAAAQNQLHDTNSALSEDNFKDFADCWGLKYTPPQS